MENNLHYWFLRNHELFGNLNEADIKELCLVTEYKAVKRDSFIYSHVNEIDRLYILNQGRVKIGYCGKTSEGVVSEILKEGDIFGEFTLKQSPNVRCEFSQVLSDEALICSFKLDEFQKLLKKHPGSSVIFSRMLAEKLKIISRKYCDLVLTDVRSRVLNFFKLHAQYEGKWTGNKAEIKMYCTHQDIADFTASSRQTVSTIINVLVKEKKIIYEGRSRLIIPDIKKLRI